MQFRLLFLIPLLLTTFISRSQKLFEDKINVATGGKTDMREAVIYLPPGYSKSKAYPLVLFSHGMGEAGKDAKKLYKQGLPRVLKKGYRPPFDFIMVAVQRNSFSVMPDWLPGILEDSKKRWKIDESRIYLTGLSAGGWSVYGSQLNISKVFAKKFAAIVINSGVTQNTNQKNFNWWKDTKTPLWAIVGGADKGYVGKNQYMVNEINKRVPALASLTVRPGVGHGGWSDVYNGKVKLKGKSMWEWMYQFKRSSVSTPNTGSDDGDSDTGGVGSGSDNDNGSDGDGDDDEEEPEEAPAPATTQRYVKVNVFKGENPALNSWNNWNVGAFTGNDIKSAPFKFTNGATSGVTATLSNSYQVADNLNNYGGGMAPAGVLRYTSYSIQKRVLTLKGLSASKTYSLILYGSRRDRPNNTTVYTINGISKSVATNNNLKKKAYFKNLKPSAAGQLKVTIENLNRFNYLNGFMLVEVSNAANK